MTRVSDASTRVPEIRKGDTVVVLSGKDAGKRGVVERVFSSPRTSGRGFGRAAGAVRALRGAYVVVEGLNIAKRHTKPRPMTSQTDRMGQLVTWTYDAASRVTSRAAGSLTTTYGYDDAGNRTSAAEGGITIATAYDRLNRPLSVTVSGDAPQNLHGTQYG